MAGISNPGYTAVPLAATGTAKTGAGILGGFVIGSGTAITVKIWDSLSATGTVILETTVAATPTLPAFVSVPAAFSVGCFVTIGGTGTITVLVA